MSPTSGVASNADALVRMIVESAKESWAEINEAIFANCNDWPARSEHHFYEGFYLSLIREFFTFKRESRILDLGCGNCFHLNWFLRHSDAYGQDLASFDYENKLPPGAGGRVKRGNATSILFPDDFFDGVFLNHVLEHIDRQEPGRVLDEIHRVLKPRGKLFLGTRNRHGFAEMFLDLTFQQLRRKQTGHAQLFTPRTLRNILEEHGFHVESMLSRSVLFFPSGLAIPWIGRYISGYPLLGIVARMFPKAADQLMRWDLRLTSRSPLIWIGFDLIAFCTSSNRDDIGKAIG
jgi:SAM-dependent methyltransferase